MNRSAVNMNRFGMSIFSISIISFLFSLYSYVYFLPENRCQMTYMFEYPEYLEVPLPDDVRASFPRYGLYAYGEGQGDFRGIPVLFIPGNAGSHRQVRSLASVSMTKTQRSKTSRPPEFNYFALDFDEELSGLYGGYLRRQTEFAAKCIYRILSLYKGKENKPGSLIIIGHSMGGIVARGLFLTDNFPVSLVNVIITLATAHSAPVAMFDAAFQHYYSEVADYWYDQAQTTLRNVTVLSIGGGVRDVMVRSDLTMFERRPGPNVFAADQSGGGLIVFETTTTDIPLVWVSTDHLCIMWCKQLVLTIVRALFDMANHDGDQSSFISWNDDIQFHRKIIRYHFFERNDWDSDLEAKRGKQAMIHEKNLWETQFLSRMAMVIRTYLQIMPALCVWYICVDLVCENLAAIDSVKDYVNGIYQCIYLFFIPYLCILWESRGTILLSLSALPLSYGVFSFSHGLAMIIVLTTCCCKRSQQLPIRDEKLRQNIWRISVIVSLIVVTSLYSLTVVVLFMLIATTVAQQLYNFSRHNIYASNTTLVIQLCLVLTALNAPWTVVVMQNYWRGGDILPYDPCLVPTLLWISGDLLSTFLKSNSIKLTSITILIGLVALILCARLYVTTYCCSVLLGFYSRVYSTAPLLSKFD